MKTTYSAITLRYVHDVVTGEFVNVGVVLYAPEQRLNELYQRLVERYQAGSEYEPASLSASNQTT